MRVRFPRWRPSDFDPWEEGLGYFEGFLLFVPLALLYWFVIPLLAVVFALPLALIRSRFSKSRWIEARARWPAPMLVRWRTTAANAVGAADEIAAALSRGYDVKVEHAELVHMTEPAGLRDLDA